MGVSCQCHAPAALYPREKNPPYPLCRRLGVPQSRSGHKGNREKILPSAGDRTSIALQNPCAIPKPCNLLTTAIANLFYIIIIIIMGSTALHGPRPSSEVSASWSVRLLLLQISWQESFPGWAFQTHAQPPSILEGRCFLSGLYPLAD
jgi:hypothetical protein